MSARSVFRKDYGPPLRAEEWERVASVLSAPFSGERNLMPHQIGNEAAIDYRAAKALVIALAESGVARNNLLIYHHSSDVPVEARPLKDGFPTLPWTCPDCGEEVYDLNDLTFDLMCILPVPVELA